MEFANFKLAAIVVTKTIVELIIKATIKIKPDLGARLA